MPVVVGVAVGALVLLGGRWLLSLRAPRSAGGIASGQSREALTRDVATRERRGGTQAIYSSSLEYGSAFGAAAITIGGLLGVVGGPAIAFIGIGLGVLVGAILEAVNHETYGRIVRDVLATWNRDHGLASSSVATDATLFRDGLLGALHLYRHRRTGQLAVEVLGRDKSGLVLSLFGGALQGNDAPFVPGPSSSQVKQQIVGWSPGMLDGPSQRNANAAFQAHARNGDLYAIDYVSPRASWRTPGYVWFERLWPRLNREHPIAKSADWEQVTPTAENVDQLAQAFDRAAGGIEWQPQVAS